MVIFVVAFNTLISLILFYAAWRIWQIKQRLSNIADALATAERSTHNVLYGAPGALSQCQQNVGKLRVAHRSLEVQIRKLKQAFSIIMLTQRIWRRYSRRILLPNQRF